MFETVATHENDAPVLMFATYPQVLLAASGVPVHVLPDNENANPVGSRIETLDIVTEVVPELKIEQSAVA